MDAGKWSEDVARGLAHPDSIAARRAREKEHCLSELARSAALSGAVQAISHHLKTVPELVAILQASSSALVARQPDTAMQDVVERIDLLADYLEFGGES